MGMEVGALHLEAWPQGETAIHLLAMEPPLNTKRSSMLLSMTLASSCRAANCRL